MKKLNKDNKGFSLVELLVVIAIMVVLVGVVAPTLLNNIEKSKEAKDIQYLDSIASAVQSTLTNEKAFDEISQNATTAVEATELFANTTGKYTNTASVITDYFAQADVAASKLSGANVKSSDDKIMVKYDNGHVIVYVATTDTARQSSTYTGVLKGKRGTDYYVSR